MLLAALLLTIASASWIVLYVLPRRRMASLTRNIPGPTGLPLIGNFLDLMGSPKQIFNILVGLHEKYGGIYKIWIEPMLYFIISNPSDAQIVLKNSKLLNRDSKITKLLSQNLGDGLVTSRDDTWRRHHKLVSAALHYKNLEPYLKIFQEKANILVELLEDIADGRTTDIEHAILMCLLDAVCDTAIGVNMNVQKSGENPISIGKSKSKDMLIHRVMNPCYHIDWIYAMSSNYKTAKSLTKSLHEFSEGVIATKLNNYRDGSNKSNDPTSGSKKTQSFLDIIIEASERGGQILSPDEIRDEVSTIAVIGTDTMTASLSFALVLLGLHPEYQDKINEELLEVFGDSDREPTIEDIRKMKHVEYWIKESLRLFPTASFYTREMSEDVEITGERILPAGSVAVVSSFTMHRNAEYFPDPESFCPERWSPENSSGNQSNAYLPFASGPRMCVGNKYALLLMPTVLIAIVRRYRVSCSSHTLEELSKNLEFGISIISAVGYKIELHSK